MGGRGARPRMVGSLERRPERPGAGRTVGWKDQDITVRVTGTGHASLFVETSAGSVLCDPWVTPAYFGSWFPFPDNSELDWERFGQADYLYVSHLHRDHYDPDTLRRYVNKDATVLLPEYPTNELRDALESLGFSKFVQPESGQVIDLDGLEVMIHALVS